MMNLGKRSHNRNAFLEDTGMLLVLFFKKNSTILCERFVDGSWKKKSFER